MKMTDLIHTIYSCRLIKNTRSSVVCAVIYIGLSQRNCNMIKIANATRRTTKNQKNQKNQRNQSN